MKVFVNRRSSLGFGLAVRSAPGHPGLEQRRHNQRAVDLGQAAEQRAARGVVLYNGTDASADMTVTLAQIGSRAGRATARDLWAHSDLGTFQDSFTTNVAAHDVVALRVVGVEPPQLPAGKVFLSDLPWVYAANGLGPVDRDQNNSGSLATPISIRGTSNTKGIGVAGPSSVVFRLEEGLHHFQGHGRNR